MPLRKVDLPPFSPQVSAGQAGKHLIGQIPQGYIYDVIVLVLTGVFVAADIPRILLKAGGTIIWDLTATELEKINKYYSLTDNVTYIPLHFSDRQAATIQGQRIGALDTVNFRYNELSLQIETDGTQSGAVGLSAFAMTGGPKDPEVAAMVRCLIPSDSSVGGTTEPISVPIGIPEAGNLIRAVHVWHTNMTDFEVWKDTTAELPKTSLAEYQFLTDEVHRTSQAGVFTYDPTMDANQGDSLDPLRFDGSPAVLQFKGTFSNTDSVRVISELYATVNTL
ncbi:MAG: hypothetical protein COB04_18770 [Gammaproteobacteria bacterium]|nr:MAG: hypothetical protein COB04_18770 [Gammaproteobacteria bacterium]